MQNTLTKHEKWHFLEVANLELVQRGQSESLIKAL